MSRFCAGYCDEDFAGQWALWEQAYERALNGRRGQSALLELHQALEAMPSKKLISGHLAANGEVCAVGALIVHRRVAKGEAQAAVLAELEAIAPPNCVCWHRNTEHTGPDGACTHVNRLGHSCGCLAFTDSGESEDYGDVTVDAGVAVGLAYTLAWRLGQLNDDDFGRCTPEERYEAVKRWIEKNLLPVPV